MCNFYLHIGYGTCTILSLESAVHVYEYMVLVLSLSYVKCISAAHHNSVWGAESLMFCIRILLTFSFSGWKEFHTESTFKEKKMVKQDF